MNDWVQIVTAWPDQAENIENFCMDLTPIKLRQVYRGGVLILQQLLKVSVYFVEPVSLCGMSKCKSDVGEIWFDVPIEAE